VEASTASVPRVGGTLAAPWWAFAAVLLAAFVLAYAIAASGSDKGAAAPAAAQPSARAPQRPDRLRDVVPLPRLAPSEPLLQPGMVTP